MHIISDNPQHDRIFQSMLSMNMFFEAVEYVQKHNLEYAYYDFEMSYKPPKFYDYIGMIHKKDGTNVNDKKEITELYNQVRELVNEKNITIYTAKHIERNSDNEIPCIDSFGAYCK